MEKLKGIFSRYREVILYIFFGGLTTVISIGSFILFHTLLGIHELVANVLSWVLAVGFAFVTNRKWVFASKAKGAAIWAEVCAFYGGRLLTLGLEEGFLLIFATWLQFNSTAVKLIAQVAVLVGNYIISKFLVFRKK